MMGFGVRIDEVRKEEDLFSSESGFRDALTGIYALMGRVETYGGNSTMGFMDMLAQTYSKVDYDYEDALKYNYKEEHVKGIVDTMWSSNYNAIANCPDFVTIKLSIL